LPAGRAIDCDVAKYCATDRNKQTSPSIAVAELHSQPIAFEKSFAKSEIEQIGLAWSLTQTCRRSVIYYSCFRIKQ
jgi:hypothetical protein